MTQATSDNRTELSYGTRFVATETTHALEQPLSREGDLYHGKSTPKSKPMVSVSRGVDQIAARSR